MVTDVYPFRAIVLQCLLLTVSVAIEAYVLQQRWRTPDDQPLAPRQSVQYAASVNLLVAVLGWVTVFTFFELTQILPLDWLIDLETALLNFIFFNRYSTQSLSLLIVAIFIAFFASFVIKQGGLWGLQWLLQLELAETLQEDGSSEGRSPRTLRNLWTRMFTTGREIGADRDRTQITRIRYLRREAQTGTQFDVLTMLTANAYSSIACLLILIIVLRFLR